jgi:hypothetical protein
MPDSNAATPLPDPNPGASKPNLTVVPEPAPSTITHGEYNKEIEAELSKAKAICVTAQNAQYSAPLATRSIDAAFVTALLADIASAGQKSQHAVACDSARKIATQAEAAAGQKLVNSLQTVQGAARVQFLPDQPAKLDSYLVGQPLAESRPLLERHSQAIIDNADTERPAGLDTDFVNNVKAERAAYLATAVAKANEDSRGQQDRAERDVLVKTIIERRKKIQYAADTLWPPRKPESVQARVDFKLPASRPYSY